jgi:hypothetical protein
MRRPNPQPQPTLVPRLRNARIPKPDDALARHRKAASASAVRVSRGKNVRLRKLRTDEP